MADPIEGEMNVSRWIMKALITWMTIQTLYTKNDALCFFNLAMIGLYGNGLTYLSVSMDLPIFILTSMLSKYLEMRDYPDEGFLFDLYMMFLVIVYFTGRDNHRAALVCVWMPIQHMDDQARFYAYGILAIGPAAYLLRRAHLRFWPQFVALARAVMLEAYVKARMKWDGFAIKAQNLSTRDFTSRPAITPGSQPAPWKMFVFRGQRRSDSYKPSETPEFATWNNEPILVDNTPTARPSTVADGQDQTDNDLGGYWRSVPELAPKLSIPGLGNASALSQAGSGSGSGSATPATPAEPEMLHRRFKRKPAMDADTETPRPFKAPLRSQTIGATERPRWLLRRNMPRTPPTDDPWPFKLGEPDSPPQFS
ncbi:hypothetical protein GGR50DRAFT_378716 [Xylaria sp. CBS 124048]|nr:hypothetical protein GGR50DRAFT_378716 [Xylaria sp. CBS 124048]